MLFSPVQSKINFYLETSQMAEVSNEVYCGKAETLVGEFAKTPKQIEARRVYLRDKPAKDAARAKMFIQSELSATPMQIELIKELVQRFEATVPNDESARLVVHILGSQYTIQNKSENNTDSNPWVSIPDDWLKKFKLKEAMKVLRKAGALDYVDYINAGNTYGSGQCGRYRLAVDWKTRFDFLAGIDVLKSKLVLESLTPEYVNSTNPETSADTKLIHTGRNLRFNPAALAKELANDYAKLAHLTGDKLISATCAYQQYARCISRMVAKATLHHKGGFRSTDIQEYAQDYIQKNSNERIYEIKGGFQNLPSRYKDAALTGTNQVMVDMKACHFTIDNHLIKMTQGSSPIEYMMKDGEIDYPIIPNLTRKDVKEIHLAILNLSSIKLFSRHEDKLSITKIILRNNKNKSKAEINKIKRNVIRICTPLHKAVAKLVGQAKANGLDKGRATMSHIFQRVEQELVSKVKEEYGINANEHDGWVQDIDGGLPDHVLNITSTILPGLTLNLTRKYYRIS